MSEQKFTPGPWFIDETKGPWILGKTAQATIGIWAQKRFDDALAVNDHDVDPEDEKWLCGAWGKCSPEDFANAHLIATAPDMYEALVAGLRALEVAVRCAGGDPATHHVCCDMRAALAKAEGKT